MSNHPNETQNYEENYAFEEASDEEVVNTNVARKSNSVNVEVHESWLSNNLNRLMIGISVLWFAFVLIYITQFFGWSNLFLMMPDEFGGFLAGVTLPLAIIWVVMAYIDRGSSFKNEAKFLRAYMNQLVYPEDGSAKTAKAMADAIRSQVVDLQEVTKMATKQTDIIKNELSTRVDDFARLVYLLDNYSGKSMRELGETIETLTKSFEYVTDKAIGTTDNFKDCIAEFNVSANLVQDNVKSLINVVGPQLENMEKYSARLQNINIDNENRMSKANSLLSDFAAKSSTNMEYVADLLNNQFTRIEDASGKVKEEYTTIEKTLDRSLSKVGDLLASQSKFVLEHVDMLDKKSDVLSSKFSEHGDKINIEIEKIMSRTNSLEESIAIQVRDLDNVSKRIEGSMQEVEDSINSQVDALEDKSKYAIATISSLVDKFEDENIRISDLTDKTMERADKLSGEVNSKNEKLHTISQEIVENLKTLSQELELSTNNIRIQSEDSISKFADVSQNVKKNADAFVESTSIIVTQSKIGETSLAQQQRHIADSVSRLDATKGELKRQIDELTRAATIVNQEAETSLSNVKKHLEEVISSSDEVARRSQKVLEDMQKQASEFDETTDRVLTKTIKAEEILEEQNKKFSGVSDNVLEKANEVKKIIERQVEAIDASTASSEKTYSNILNSFESQSVLINSVAENTVSYVSDVVQALDEKAEAINLLFKHQENEFKDICDKISENTGNIGASLKQNLSTIEQSADRVFSRMALLEEDVTKRSEAVIVNSGRTIDKLAEVDNIIGLRNQEVNEFIKSSTDKLKEIAETFKTNIGTFGNIVREVKDESNETTNNLLMNFNKVKEVNSELVQETKNISIVIDNNIKNIDGAMIKAKAQSDSIRDSFEQQKESLTDIVNVVATQSRLGETSLTQQYKLLSDVSTDVAKKMNEINEKFKEGTDKVFDTTGKVAYEIDVLGDRLLKVSEDVSKSSKSTIKDVEQVNMSLSQCSEDLSRTAKESNKAVSEVIKNYEGHISRFSTVTAEASTSVVEISDLITEQNDKMIKISEDTKQLVDCFNVVLNDTSLQLSNRANYAYDKVKGLGESFKNLSMQLEETTKHSSKHLENSGDKLRSSIAEITANAERISNEIRNSGEVFLKQSEVLVGATDETLKKVENVMNVLNKSTSEFVSKSDNIVQKSATFNEMFDKQINLLGTTSKKAEEKIKELNKGYDEVELSNFLKSAAHIVEQLEAASVDINRIYNPESEEELWKKYYNGDSSAFVRHLEKTMTKKQIINIKTLFEKNVEFRTFVTRYISEFEHLLDKAKKSENASLLLSVLSGSDIGKIYYILAKSLDKID
ncbi:MAG: hypothetical protein ACK5N8_07820 [Alphaproteobacteria bacterium]